MCGGPVDICLGSVMSEHAVEDEPPVLVPFRARRDEAPLDECACLVLLLRVKRENAVVYNLNDVAECGCVGDAPGGGEGTFGADACVEYLLGQSCSLPRRRGAHANCRTVHAHTASAHSPPYVGPVRLQTVAPTDKGERTCDGDGACGNHGSWEGRRGGRVVLGPLCTARAVERRRGCGLVAERKRRRFNLPEPNQTFETNRPSRRASTRPCPIAT